MHEDELQSHQLSTYADQIRSASLPSIVGLPCYPITGSPSDSYFGGMPRVTPDFQWPTKDGYPLAFVGQLRCSQLGFMPTNDGNLLFFYDNRHFGYSPKDIGHAVVIHQQASDALTEPDLPSREVSTLFGLHRSVAGLCR